MPRKNAKKIHLNQLKNNTMILTDSLNMKEYKMSRLYQPMFYQIRTNKPVTGSVNGIKINLIQNCNDIFTQELKKHKVKRKSKDDPISDYFRWQGRLLEEKPRKIYVAKEFTCPAGYEEKLEYIKRSILSGKNLNKFMSRSIKNLKDEDLMLYDWGIYHFHLSDKLDTVKKDGFMERSDYLLMTRVDDEAVYMIRIVPHKEKNVWTCKDYIQIVEENWPETIRQYKLENCTMERQISERELYKLRKDGVLTFTQLDNGNLYALLGGGYATDGSSTKVVQKSGKFIRIIGEIEKLIIGNFWAWIKDIPEFQQLYSTEKRAVIRLISMWKNNYLFKEETADLYIKLNEVNGKTRIILSRKLESIF